MSFPKAITNTTFFAIMLVIILPATFQTSYAQEKNTTKHEKYGGVFNAGMGAGYFGAQLLPAPYFTANYEIQLAHNTTLAPFFGFASYRGDPEVISGVYYYHRATLLPFGVKGTYYIDKLLLAPPRWDFYVAGSIGYGYYRKVWDFGYSGPVGTVPGITPTFIQVHIGAEFHINKQTGLFFDAATGGSVIGICIH